MASLPEAYFPPSMVAQDSPDERPIFCVVPERMHLYKATRDADVACRPPVTLTRPALLVAVDGPAGWGSLAPSATLDEVSTNLSKHVEPNLRSLETMRQSSSSANDSGLQDFGIIFGIAYDSQHVHLVAHFMIQHTDDEAEGTEKTLVSLLVDTFEFPANDGDVEGAEFQLRCEQRARLMLALLTVQRHVFRLACSVEELEQELQMSCSVCRMSLTSISWVRRISFRRRRLASTRIWAMKIDIGLSMALSASTTRMTALTYGTLLNVLKKARSWATRENWLLAERIEDIERWIDTVENAG